MGADAFVLLRDGMKEAKVAAIAQTVLFRRMRTVLIRAHGKGLIATTLNFDYEVRSSKEAFEDMPELEIKGEMLELASHIIGTKRERLTSAKLTIATSALAELVKAKMEGRTLPKPKAVKVSEPTDLLQALRESAGMLAAAGNAPKRTAANGNAGIKRPKTATRATAPKAKAASASQRRAG